jgi:predicted ester cyclase
MIAEGDQVAIRWHWSGTHRGTFRGIAPTERALTNNGIGIFRLQAGKIVAASLETDRLGFLQGIGVLPGVDALFGSPTASQGAAR